MSDGPQPPGDPVAPEPGWYPDPLQAGGQRWWDGDRWDPSTMPAQSPGSSPRRRLPVAIKVLLGLAATGALFLVVAVVVVLVSLDSWASNK